ncbi:hypothetical protein RUM44_004350 [Polyplax serrata]|uniref:Uncharacterized protein n=1 Tax=Polyplax serrata TaxID=468196 RepID=A0ABR1B2K6_POLSC
MDMGMGHHEDHPDSSHHDVVHYGLIPEEPKKKHKIKMILYDSIKPSPVDLLPFSRLQCVITWSWYFTMSSREFPLEGFLVRMLSTHPSAYEEELFITNTIK